MFATLFFGGAALSAGAGNGVVQLIDPSSDQAQSAGAAGDTTTDTTTTSTDASPVAADGQGNFTLGDVANPPTTPYPVTIAANGYMSHDTWITWARRSRIPAFVHLQRKIATHRDAIDAALETGLSQGLIESTNTKIRLLTRIAFGFHGYQPLVALAMLALGSHPPRLPGRN